ncbi:MAG: AAA family ATPase [Planctomycetota bacterium]|nr:AAA family ATPase [Planctomycetota bacterium]
MDIAAYLRQQKEQIGHESRQVKDFSVFDFNYIPPQPVVRMECKELIDEMLRFEVSGIASHYAVIGSRGSGKTLMLKYLQRIMPGQTCLEFLYANCRHHNTSFKIFSHLLGGQIAGGSLTGLYDRFLQKYRRKTVVVLDEVDLMSPKDKHREILYLLSRSEQPYMIVMLSNSPHLVKQLDAATRSSLQPVPLHFKNYNAEQIHEILRDRAAQGLHRWDDGSIAQIAALTTRLTNADARVAIKTLKYTVTKPGEDLTNCFERARRDIVVDMVNDLSDANLMILWAAATSKSDLAKEIYQRYCRFSQTQQEKPFSYVYFYSNLSYLQSVGLVALVSTKVGRTYTNRVLATFDTSIVDSLFKLRFG